MKQLITLTLFILSSFSVLKASNGTITGKILDAKTNETMIGAYVTLDTSAKKTVVTDVDGNYKFENVSPGMHHLTIKMLSFNTIEMDVNVGDGETVVKNASMSNEVKEIKETVVTAKKTRNTETAVVMEVKKANSIVSGISAAQIQKSQDRNAADVVKRIPGVTIQEGRFINIRGLSERYNDVMLNDAGAPSSEADKRAFSFDVIPSGMIERILIYKTPSAELPGDFAGGTVKIYTQAMPEKNSVQASYTTSFREGTTFKPFYYTKGSSTDMLGFDNGFRSIPANAPAQISKNDTNNTSVSQGFKGKWAILNKNAIPDQRVSFSLQGVIKKEKFSIGNTFSVNYSHVQSSYAIQRADYDSLSQNTKLTDTVSNRTVTAGIMENLAIRFGNNTIEFRNLFNQIGREQTTMRGDTFNGQDNRFYGQYYQARTTYLTQLSGNHKFIHSGTTYNWNLSYDYSSRNEPDFRRIKYAYNPIDSTYKALIANVVDPVNGGGRFYSKLHENIFSFNHSVNQKVTAGNYEFEINAGNYVEYKSRTFEARILGYTIAPGQNAFNYTKFPLSDIFNDTTVGGKKNFRIDEITSLSDRYKAQNFQVGSFVSFNFPIAERAKIIVGVRHEYNSQSLQSHVNLDSISPSIKTNFILPSLNASVNINEKMLVRVAYGMTVNRPEFREWSPFYFYDFEFNAGNYGSLFPTVYYPKGTTLKVAQIQNVDLRYEYYPSPGDLIHVGGFFKYFNDPIQQVITPTSGSDSKAFTYINGDKAYTFGAEVDLRKNLGFIGKNWRLPIFSNFTLVANAALIKSKLTLPNLPGLTTSSALQGQSPYIVNAGLYFQRDTIGLSASLLYNVFGPRIYAIGNQFYPNIGERPRHSLDFSVTYTLKKKVSFTFAIQDILNQAYRLTLDTDRNGKFQDNNIDKDIRNYKMGRLYSLGIKLKI